MRCNFYCLIVRGMFLLLMLLWVLCIVPALFLGHFWVNVNYPNCFRTEEAQSN